MTNFENANAVTDTRATVPGSARELLPTAPASVSQPLRPENSAQLTRHTETNGITRKLLKTNNWCHVHSTHSKSHRVTHFPPQKGPEMRAANSREPAHGTASKSGASVGSG